MRRSLARDVAFGLALSLVGCRKSAPELETEGGVPPREADPPELGDRGVSVCHAVESQAFAILSETDKRIEVGKSVPVPGGFAVSAVAHGTGSEARLFVRADGQTRDVTVGPIYGGGEPPNIAAQAGTIFLSWADADAGGRRVRVGAVSIEGSALRVRKVIEIDTPLRPLEGVEVQALGGKLSVVWDSLGSASSGASGVYCALYDSATLAAIARPRRLTPPGEDASRPTLLPRPGGYWLLWVATLERTKVEDPSEGRGLVDAPPERLRVVRLGEDCAPLGNPLDLTSAGENIEYDAVGTVDSLLVLSRDDRSLGYGLRSVDLSGTVALKGPLDPPDLEFPRLVSLTDGPWMVGRAKDGAPLLGRIVPEGPVFLRPESSLLGAEVLGATNLGVVLERARSADQEGTVPIDVVSCGTGAERLK